jgi:uncharacterized protein YgiM (DUF1202 family)
VNKFISAPVIWVLTLALVTIYAGGCIINEGGLSKKKDDKQLSEKPAPVKPNHVPSNLFQALLVSVDSCYVFLKPERRSAYFGPLIKGEEITKISARGDWFYVWVPRLRTSGWIQKKKARKSGEINSDPGGVPKTLLNTVTVITARANIRKGPSTKFKVIHRARKREEFTVINKKQRWYQIWIPELNENGWVYEKIVTRNRKNQ